MCPFKCLKESIQIRFFFQTINDGLSLLIPIHACSKWKKLTGPFLRSVVKQKYVDGTYKISHILRNVYATDMILVSL